MAIPTISRNWSFCRQRDRRADRAEELAAALDAGLGADAAFATIDAPTAGRNATFGERFRAAFPGLGPIEFACVDAADRAGSLGHVLRDLAERERRDATLLRDLAGRLAYPAFLTVFGGLLIGWLAWLGQGTVSPRFGIAWSCTVAALIGLGWLLFRRARRDPAFDVSRVPMFGALATHAALLPYLDALRRLYGAGVRIDEAHELAMTACGLAHQRARLTAVTSSLRAGATYGSALDAARALDADLRRRLGAAEKIGELEKGLQQSAQWLRTHVDLGLRRAVRFVGGLAYALVVVLVAAIVLGFYGNVYRGLLH